MKQLPELPPLARQLETFWHSPDELDREAVVSIEGFRKLFGKHAGIWNEIMTKKSLTPPRASLAVERKYTEAYMEYLYEEERAKSSNGELTWKEMANYLDQWERDTIPYKLLTSRNSPDGKTPRE